MGVIQRAVIFTAGTITNAVLFLFHSRVVLEVVAVAKDVAGSGPATSSLNALPMAMQLAMGVLQVGLIVYLLGGLGEEKTTTTRPMQ